MQASDGVFGRGEGGQDYGPSLSRLLQGADNSEPPQWTPSNGDAMLASTVRQPTRRNNDMSLIALEKPKLVSELQLAQYARMRQFWDSTSPGVPRLSTVPSAEAMNLFVQLYFQHFHAQFPLLHMPTFQPREDIWMLVLAVAAIGAEYSGLCTEELMVSFEHVARKAISHIVSPYVARHETRR